MSSIELFKILSKPWANVNDIKIIASCGRDTAAKIRNIIAEDISKKGKYIPNSKEKIVPMISVIDYLSLDVDYIAKMAQKEKSITI